MALTLITNPPTELTLSSHWGELVERSGKNMLGMGLSIPLFTLTNWDASTTKPEIALGSIIEVGGSFYQAGSITSLTDDGGLIDGTVHIKLVPAGGGATVVPTLTNDAIPAWDATKAGWYDGVDKFLPYEMTKASAVYTKKGEYNTQNKGVIGSELPIGFMYTQYPAKKSPIELGMVGVWTNVSSSFAGDFFRSEGGAASTFESGQQAFTTDLKTHTHDTVLGSHNHTASRSGPDTAPATTITTTVVSRSNTPIEVGISNTNLGTKTSGSPSTTGDTETRPINRTIRLWERTA